MSDTSEKKAPVFVENAHVLTITLRDRDYKRKLSYALGQKQDKPVIKPRFDYQAEEARYVDGRYLSATILRDPKKQEELDQLVPSLTQQLTKVNGLRLHIETYQPRRDAGIRVFQPKKQPRLHWPDEVAPLVHEALRAFGYDAIRLAPADAILVSGHSTLGPDYNSLLIELDGLGRVIGEIIRDWQSRVVEEQDIEKRRRVQAYLQDIGPLLVPSMQGKRANRVMKPYEVKRYYYQQRFACEQAKALLQTLEHVLGFRRVKVRLRAVCDLLHLPHDPRWWGYADHGYVLRQLLNSTESATGFTARHFAPATEQTIRNILAS